MLLQTLIWLIVGIALIVTLTAILRVHAFFALLAACIVVGVGVGIPVIDILGIVKSGFGNIMSSLAMIIILGTTLGVLLEHTGCTRVMAGYILKIVGPKRSALAMSLSGFVVGLPIFCDSGYVVLSGLNRTVAARAAIPVVTMAVSLASGLYSVHCLVPPHPGASAAAGILDVDFGKLLLAGIVVAIPASAAGYMWARYAGRKFAGTSIIAREETHDQVDLSVIRAFLPVIIPLILISLRSIFAAATPAQISGQILNIAGDPVVALFIGVLLAMSCKRSWTKDGMGTLLEDAIYKAGGILVIIGAGGSFGAVLAATKIGSLLGENVSLESLGILFPFLLTFVIKTAQGSSTVAIITAASIIQPLLPSLGLDSDSGKLLAVLSMGAGSMMISHANDAYFWVIAKFSGLEMRPMLTVYTMATVWMGCIAIMIVYLMSLVIN